MNSGSPPASTPGGALQQMMGPTIAAAQLKSGESPGRGRAAWKEGYFTKYQLSGVMDNVDDCGVTPLRLFATSVS
jgi:hypothetical protein